jgi:UDP-glucose:glycoprotein glucosyltransferase
MHKEQAIVDSLVKFGLTPGQAVTLLTHDTLAKSQTGSSMEEGLVDASDRPEDGKAITWWNDISKDAKYASYADGIYSILQPMYPGQFHRIKLNLWNIVVAVDLSKTSAINFLGGSVHNIISRNFPFRFGVVPLCETQDGAIPLVRYSDGYSR